MEHLSRPDTSIRISPSAPTLPANMLRFYVHFPRPAEALFDRAGLRLLDQDGETVPDPFLVFSQELWSPDGRRLTVLMEPGRIKRGMGEGSAHEPALVVGRDRTLAVTAMGETARYRFRVGPAIRAALDPAAWQVEAPAAGSADPLAIRFDRVVDAASCADEVAVRTPSGHLLPIGADLAADGRTARLRPGLPWTAGEHRLLVSRRFEDVCGNRLGEALDHDLAEPGRPAGTAIPFLVTQGCGQTAGSRSRNAAST